MRPKLQLFFRVNFMLMSWMSDPPELCSFSEYNDNTGEDRAKR